MLLSIIIPIYNRERTLRECLNSVCPQVEGMSVEILLIDDGSIDGSADICHEYIEKYSFIKYFYKENEGIANTRNYGLQQASGENILFVDSDDCLFDGSVAKCLSLIQASQADILVFSLCKENVVTGDREFLVNRDFLTEDGLIALKYLLKNKSADTYACNKIFKKTVFDELKFSEGVLYEDMDLIPKVVFLANKIQFTSFVGYCYIKHEKSITGGIMRKNQFDNINNRIKLKDFFVQQGIKDRELSLILHEVIVDGFLSVGYKIQASSNSIEEKRRFNSDIRKLLVNTLLRESSFYCQLQVKLWKKYLGLFLLMISPNFFELMFRRFKS